jgi:hypothetical protein
MFFIVFQYQAMVHTRVVEPTAQNSRVVLTVFFPMILTLLDSEGSIDNHDSTTSLTTTLADAASNIH